MESSLLRHEGQTGAQEAPEGVGPTFEERLEHVEYWANFEGEEFTRSLAERIRDARSWLEGEEYFQKVCRNVEMYLDRSADDDWGGSAIKVVGESGESLLFEANKFRALLRQVHTMVVAEKPHFEVGATKADYQARQSAKLGKTLLSHYLDRGMWAALRQADEYAGAWTMGGVFSYWDGDFGRQVDFDDFEGFFYEGDIRYRALRPFIDFQWDYRVQVPWVEQKWVLVREWRDKGDLMVQFPDLADDIREMSKDTTFIDTDLVSREEYLRSREDEGTDSTDDVLPCYHFFHDSSMALPGGRHVYIVGNKVAFEQGWDRGIPIDVMYDEEYEGFSLGGSSGFLIQPYQEALTEVMSKIISSFDALGYNLLWVQTGSAMPDPRKWQGPVPYIESDSKPEVIELSVVPPEVYTILEMILRQMDEQFGMHQVAQGGTGENVRAGVMQGFMQEQTRRIHSTRHDSFLELVEKVGTRTLNVLKDYPSGERITELAGVHEQGSLVHWRKEDLFDSTSMKVNVGPEMTRTQSGRLSILGMLAQFGFQIRPEDAVALLEGAPLEVLTGTTSADIDTALLENEEFLRGIFQHNALPTDNHQYHVKTHAQLLGDPRVRANPQLLEIALSAILDHLTQWLSPQGTIFQMALGYDQTGLMATLFSPAPEKESSDA